MAASDAFARDELGVHLPGVMCLCDEMQSLGR